MKPPLSQRIQAENFRFLEDALRALKKYEAEIDELLGHQKLLIRQTAAMFLQVNLKGPGAQLKHSPTIEPTGGKNIQVKDLEKLRKNYGVIHELWDTRESLEMMAVRIRQSFVNRGGETQKAIGELEKLKKRVDLGLEEAFTFVAGLASQNLPSKFDVFNRALGLILEKSIAYQDSKQYTYIYEVEGDLCFSTYTQLLRVVDDAGTFYPELYIVSSYRTGGVPTTYVAVLTKFVPPSERLLMRRVTTVKETTRALNMLLAMDNFVTSVGSLPTSLMLKSPTVDKSLFLYQNMIKSIRVDAEQVVFVLKPEITQKAVADKVINQIYLDFKGVINKTGATVKMAIKDPTASGNKCFVLTFFFIPPNDALQANEQDLAFLKERFQLSDTTLRSIVKTINSGSEF